MHYKFNEFAGSPQNQDAGLKTTDAAPFLSRSDGRICPERDWPYIPRPGYHQRFGRERHLRSAPGRGEQPELRHWCVQDHRKQGIDWREHQEHSLPRIASRQGYNVVFGCFASWDDKDNNGVLDPLLDSNGHPVSKCGHAMLIVGYNRTDQYFIVKNSWAPTWGHSGYAYFSYNFVRACAKYGFVVDSVVPAAPPSPLSRKLATAPFGVDKISRQRLRAAVVFFKTSSGRFAVAEAYAGDNLYRRICGFITPTVVCILSGIVWLFAARICATSTRHAKPVLVRTSGGRA